MVANQQIKDVKAICLALAIGAGLSLVYGVQLWFGAGPINWFLDVASLAVLVLNLIAYWIAARRLVVALWLLLLSFDLALVVLMVILVHPVFFGLVFLSLNLGLLALSRVLLLSQSVFVAVATVALCVTNPQILADGMGPAWFVLIGLAVVICNRFAGSLAKAHQVIDGQIVQLQSMVGEKEQKRQTGAVVSTETNLCAGQLNQTANRQKNRTVAQAQHVVQLRSLLLELDKSATTITNTTGNVLHGVENVSECVAAIQHSSGEVATRSTEAVAGMESAYRYTERTLEAYLLLTRGLEEAVTNAHQLDKVGRLITHIAEEINCLALNAAIEAASAGEYGQRFKVVASSVKELAASTAQQSSSIRTLLTNTLQSLELVQGEVVNLEQLADDNLHQSKHARTTLLTLSQVIEGHLGKVEQIGQVATQAHNLAVGIKTATLQQKIACEAAVGDIEAFATQVNEDELSAVQLSTSAAQLAGLAARLDALLAA